MVLYKERTVAKLVRFATVPVLFMYREIGGCLKTYICMRTLKQISGRNTAYIFYHFRMDKDRSAQFSFPQPKATTVDKAR